MLNVNSAIYSAQGVDVNNVAKVSSQILAESAKTPTVQAIDYSKFNRATLGIDLYSSRTNSDLQKQIAMTQAGLYAKAINVAKLNSAAAASLYSANAVAKNAAENENLLLSLRILLVSFLILRRFNLMGVYSSYSSISAQRTIGFFLVSVAVVS